MKHASAASLARLSQVLEHLRAQPMLTERSPGSFYRKSKAYAHFHEDPAGLFADVKLDGVSFTRLPVSTVAEQRTLIRLIDDQLSP